MRNTLRVILGVLVLLSFTSPVVANDSNKELVILLHGIGNAEWNMAGIEYNLKKEGYGTLNIGYPSVEKNIQDLSEFLNKELTKENVWEKPYKKIHFTTHSMGGLVLREYLKNHKTEISLSKLGRVVMLAPPHGGSEVADLLKDNFLYQWVYGPAGQDLTTEHQTNINNDVYYELGIIAGDKDWPYVVAAHIIPNDSDGRVALEKTKLEGMKDHITLSATHTFMSWKPSVYKQIIYFLKNGNFKHAK